MLNGVRETQRWDYEAYIAIPFDGKKHEIVSGEHFANPAPSLYHQQVSRRLQFDLYQSIELGGHGVVINAPVDVQLSSNTIVQPDLVVISKSNSHIMTPTKVKGVPDLLIEILSPSNSNYDLVVKRKSYLEHRVARYWIVDPEEHLVHVLNLRENEYVASVETDQLALDLPPSIRVDLKNVW